MADVKGISELGFRSCIDTIADILGENGKNSILRYANLEDYISNPPAYNLETIVTPNSIVTRFFKAVRDIMGDKGYDTIMFRAGVETVKVVVAHVPDFQSLVEMDLEPKEKIRLAYFGYVAGSKDDPETTLEFHLDQNEVVMHFPECNECWEIVEGGGGLSEFAKSSCSYVRGLVQQVAGVMREVSSASCNEETCRMRGADECRFRIRFELG
jgi:predicted hydrocarbon binding protein